ncbi:hypothetical protein [Amycolatopsis sp. NPDC059021]|uniref:hypothetical protein n=1 Tax=Amycolatopsis sp. NPDC059021 TaxID=3346704 RepID=UPI00366C86D1
MSEYPELAYSAKRLFAQPPVEPSQGTPEVVCGYVRTARPDPDDADADACGGQLRRCTDNQSWELGTIFRDLGSPAEAVLQSALAGALDMVRQERTTSLLVVSCHYLAETAAARKRLTMAVYRTSSTIRVLARDVAR